MLKKINIFACFTATVITSMILIHPGYALSKENSIAQTMQDKMLLSLADKYFDEFYFPNNPTAATSAGIHQYDNNLESYAKNDIEAKISALKTYEKEFASINPNNLSEQAQGDRDLILGAIRSQLLTYKTIRPWEKNPDIYSSGIANSAFVIMSRQFAPVNDRLRAMIAREKLMPGVFAVARNNLKNPPKIYTEIALEQLPGLIEYFQKDVPLAFANATDTNLKKQFKASNAAVIQALRGYQEWLKKDLLPKSHGDFRIGAKTYSQILLYDEMVDVPLDQLIKLDMENMHQNQKEFAAIAKQIDPAKSTQEILQTLQSDHPAPDKLLASFQATFDDLIQFIKNKEIITIPSDIRPILEPTPPFMTATTFASMDTPGPFEKNAREAFFNVTLPDASWNQAKIRDFMTQFSYPVISGISAHEAYPGHYTQFLWMHNINDRIRQLLGARTNVEGWAHYCEQMLLDEGFRQPGQGARDSIDAKMYRLGQLLSALKRNARFVVGIKMHTGQMTYNQAIDFFVKEGYQSRTSAVMETKRGTADPTYLYYTLGKLQIQKLRKDVEKKQGKFFNLKQFHDDFMKQGFPPIKIVRKAMLHDDSATL